MLRMEQKGSEWSKKGAHGNYFHEMTLNALFTIHKLTSDGVSINFLVKQILWKSKNLQNL